MKYTFTFLFFILFLGCKSNFRPDTTRGENMSSNDQSTTPSFKECYQFDQRQCMTDKWADNFGLDLDAETKASRMKAWLNSQNLKVSRVIVNMKFHEFTCEACNTCPYEHRFFVEVTEKSESTFNTLNLLNLSSCDCSSF